jgi:hypothetical protein
MKDILCVFMGIADIIAGILIMFLLENHIIGIIFGIFIIGKGVISLI